MNARQEDRLERIERLLASIADSLRDIAATNMDKPLVRRRSGLNDLVTASVDHVATLERDRRDRERSNGWAPDSELSWRDQYERLSRGVQAYEREVDSKLGNPDDPQPSRRLPWNQERDERIRPIETKDRETGGRDRDPRRQEARRYPDRQTDLP